jgi:hypothetical protein
VKCLSAGPDSGLSAPAPAVVQTCAVEMSVDPSRRSGSGCLGESGPGLWPRIGVHSTGLGCSYGAYI